MLRRAKGARPEIAWPLAPYAARDAEVERRRARSLVRPLTLGGRLGAQPQRGVLGLHGAPGYPYQVCAQSFEIRLFSKPGVEGLKSLCGIILPAVETAVYESLYPSAQRVE